jgi:putative ATPase
VRRTHGGDTLAQTRDAVFDDVKLARDGLVLDLHARTGLLTFEAVRRAPEGSVWALAHNDKEFETVHSLASQLETLRRPTVILSAMSTFDTDLRASAGKSVAFDAIVGRNIVGILPDKIETIRRAVLLSRPAGRISLAETVYALGQRISSLLPPDGAGQDSRQLLAEAEELLFADKEDPFVNWTPETIAAACAGAGLTLHARTVAAAPLRRITPNLVDHWFRPAVAGARISLGRRLAQLFGEESAIKVKRQVHAALDHKDIPWSVVTAYLTITTT